jgi:hypothetical protein
MKPLANLLVFALWHGGETVRGTVATYVIEGPTVIAFFQPVPDAELAKDADTNEALGDFQLYAMHASPKLKKIGIDFQVVTALKFKIKIGKAVRTFKSGKVGIGYYFIRPGRSPLVRYGVMRRRDPRSSRQILRHENHQVKGKVSPNAPC